MPTECKFSIFNFLSLIYLIFMHKNFIEKIKLQLRKRFCSKSGRFCEIIRLEYETRIELANAQASSIKDVTEKFALWLLHCFRLFPLPPKLWQSPMNLFLPTKIHISQIPRNFSLKFLPHFTLHRPIFEWNLNRSMNFFLINKINEKRVANQKKKWRNDTHGFDGGI